MKALVLDHEVKGVASTDRGDGSELGGNCCGVVSALLQAKYAARVQGSQAGRGRAERRGELSYEGSDRRGARQ